MPKQMDEPDLAAFTACKDERKKEYLQFLEGSSYHSAQTIIKPFKERLWSNEALLFIVQ
jgi:hypothetical protein